MEILEINDTRIEASVGEGRDRIPGGVREHADPAARAVRMALSMRAAMGQLAERWRERGHQLGFGAAIDLGKRRLALSEPRSGTTTRTSALGVNLAARLCAEAEPGQGLVTQRVHEDVRGLVEASPAGDYQLKGMSQPGPTFTEIGLRGGD